MSKTRSSLEISWLGLDGFLIALYFIEVGVIFWAIKFQNDFIISKLLPYGFMVTVTLIFADYLANVFKFRKPIKNNPESKNGNYQESSNEN